SIFDLMVVRDNVPLGINDHPGPCTLIGSPWPSRRSREWRRDRRFRPRRLFTRRASRWPAKRPRGQGSPWPSLATPSLASGHSDIHHSRSYSLDDIRKPLSHRWGNRGLNRGWTELARGVGQRHDHERCNGENQKSAPQNHDKRLSLTHDDDLNHFRF